MGTVTIFSTGEESRRIKADRLQVAAGVADTREFAVNDDVHIVGAAAGVVLENDPADDAEPATAAGMVYVLVCGEMVSAFPAVERPTQYGLGGVPCYEVVTVVRGKRGSAFIFPSTYTVVHFVSY